MKTVAKIIDLQGGMDSLRQKSIRVPNPPYMRLVLEYIGEGPRGLSAISVAHYYEQNGDLMRDPEIVFEISESGEWEPVLRARIGIGDSRIVLAI